MNSKIIFLFILLAVFCSSCKKDNKRAIDENGTVFIDFKIIDSLGIIKNTVNFSLDTLNLDENYSDYSHVNLYNQLTNPDSIYISYNSSFYYAFLGNTSSGLKPILFQLSLRERIFKGLIDTNAIGRFKFKNDEDFYNSFSLGKIKFSVNDTYRPELASEMLMNISNDFYRTALLNDTTENINNNEKYYFEITNIYLDKNSKSVYLNVEFVAPWALMNTMTNYTIQGKARIKISNKFTN